MSEKQIEQALDSLVYSSDKAAVKSNDLPHVDVAVANGRKSSHGSLLHQ